MVNPNRKKFICNFVEYENSLISLIYVKQGEPVLVQKHEAIMDFKDENSIGSMFGSTDNFYSFVKHQNNYEIDLKNPALILKWQIMAVNYKHNVTFNFPF